MSEFLKGRQMRPTPLEERLMDEEFMVSAMPVHKFNRQQKQYMSVKRSSHGLITPQALNGSITPDECMATIKRVPAKIPQSLNEKAINGKRMDILKSVPAVSSKCWGIYDVNKM